MERIKIDIVVPSSIISFGKYKGKTFQWILNENPRYILWLQQNGIQNISFEGNFIITAYQMMCDISQFEFEMLENQESVF